MSANCVICSDLFNEINAISVAPCGHVYHSGCLRLWISQSETCPQCRACICQKDIQRLYFNFVPKYDFNSSELENEIINLKAQLGAKDAELAACKKQKAVHLLEIAALVQDAIERASDLQVAYMNEHEMSELRKSDIAKLEAKVLKLERKNAVLTNFLLKLKDSPTEGMKITIQRAKEDMKFSEEYILEEYDGNYTESVKESDARCTSSLRESERKIDELLFNMELCVNAALERIASIRIKKKCSTNSFDASTSIRKESCEEIIIYDSGCHSHDVKSTNIASAIAAQNLKDGSSVAKTGRNGVGGESNVVNSSEFEKEIRNLKARLNTRDVELHSATQHLGTVNRINSCICSRSRRAADADLQQKVYKNE